MDIKKIYIGQNPLDSDGKVVHIAELIETPVKSFKDMFESFFKTPLKGHKQLYYTTIANNIEEEPGDSTSSAVYRQSPFRRHYDVTQTSAQFIAYDGDGSKTNPDSCVSVKEIKAALDFYEYNYILYTTHSHLNNNDHYRWRILIPCYMTKSSQLKPTVLKLFRQLEARCPDLLWTNESTTWSQPWFLALREDPEDGLHEAYFNDGKKDFEAEAPSKETETKEPTTVLSSDSTDHAAVVSKIVLGEHPLHENMRKWIYGAIRDGRQPKTAEADLLGFMAGWDMSNQKLAQYYKDVPRQVSAAAKKLSVKKTTDEWSTSEYETDDTNRVYTKYPDLGGMAEEMVKDCMSWMIFPNRQIAVTAVRGLLSALGARVYTLPDGQGVNLTALITGRSTIGKSNIKKFFIWAMDNLGMNKYSAEYLGAQHYTSPKNLVDDLRSKISLYSVRTESGQSDKSSAGDMPRIMNYELEFATEGGQSGYVSKGGQNADKAGNESLPALYSPPVTTIRESVAKIQNDADNLNQSTIAGVMGRRSVIAIDPVKGTRNHHRIEKPSPNVRKLILEIHKLAAVEVRKDCTKPLDPKMWITIQSENPEFLLSREAEWLEKENAAAMRDDELESTFYGRLYERIPAFAGTLAFADNPLSPLITNEQYEIAEKCLYEEFMTHRKQSSCGALDGPWGVLMRRVEDVFRGNMMKHVKRYDKRLQAVGKKELEQGAIEWTPLSRILQPVDAYVSLKDKNGFKREFVERVELINIYKMKEYEVKDQFGHERMTLIRK